MNDPEKLITELPETEIPMPPADPELPEEGFVPFAAEAAANKQKRKAKLLVWLLCIAALFGAFLICCRVFGFYRRTMKHLHFDYRAGEAVKESKTDGEGDISEKVRNALGSSYIAEANVYCFNSQAALSLTVSHYRYECSPDGAYLDVKTGTDGGLFPSSDRYHADSTGRVTKISGSKEISSDDTETANLGDYFFETESYSNKKLSRQNTYYTSVNGSTYVCELWLMEAPAGGKTVYYTIYRYYQEDRLAGIRVLSSENDLMMVYDITDYAAK